MKNEIRCSECNGKIINDPFRNENYCDQCGLVLTPNHPMGYDLNSLIGYANHEGLQNHTESIRTIGTFQGLRDARLAVAKLVLNK